MAWGNYNNSVCWIFWGTSYCTVVCRFSKKNILKTSLGYWIEILCNMNDVENLKELPNDVRISIYQWYCFKEFKSNVLFKAFWPSITVGKINELCKKKDFWHLPLWNLNGFYIDDSSLHNSEFISIKAKKFTVFPTVLKLSKSDLNNLHNGSQRTSLCNYTWKI